MHQRLTEAMSGAHAPVNQPSLARLGDVAEVFVGLGVLVKTALSAQVTSCPSSGCGICKMLVSPHVTSWMKSASSHLLEHSQML
jgi:hypothetical protein